MSSWESPRLGDIVTLEYGRSLTAEARTGDGYPVIGSSGVTGYHSHAFVAGPSIIVGRKGTVGSITWSEQNSWPIDTAYWVSPKRELDLRWLYWALKMLGLEYMDSSTGVPGLNRTEAYSAPTPLPPMREQQRIAEILDSVDDQIRLSTSLIAKQKELRIAAIRELAADGLRCFQGLEASELLRAPNRGSGSWSLVPLGSLLIGIDAGHSPDLEDTPAGPGQWGVLKVSAVGEDGFRPDENKVAPYRGLHAPKICVRTGDLLMTRANTSQLVGRSCIVGDVQTGLMLSDKILRLKVAERQAPTRYVHIVLGLAEVRRQIEIAATGTSNSMKNISQNSVRQLIVPLGSQDDISRIVEIDTLHEARITALRDEVAGLRLLKQGLMDDLLTGRVRVPVS